MPKPNKGPLALSLWKPLADNPLPYAGLLTSLPEEHDYEPAVAGNVPPELKGTLYRNGPGLFDRGGLRKRMALDGDGLIQAFRIAEGKIRYRNRFVRTEKFLREQSAGAFCDATWSTLRPGGMWKNIGGRVANQAGVTVIRRPSGLFAFDEAQLPYALDPDDLSTIGPHVIDEQRPKLVYHAHWKVDSEGRWWNVCFEFGRQSHAVVTGSSASDAVTGRWRFLLPRGVYMHDWFVTENHFVFLLHPAYVPLSRFLRVMIGRETFSEAVEWRRDQGNLVAVFPKADAQKPRFFETEASWMWHAYNAFEKNGEIVADFIGSNGEGGIGDASTSPIFQVMRGEDPEIPTRPLDCVRRYVLSGQRISSQIVSEERNYEMPFVSPRVRSREHRYGYMAAADPGQLFWSSVCRLDFSGGRLDSYHFGRGHYCTEPVFAPRPGGQEGEGWILTEGYENATKRSFLAILDAQRLSDGPLATARLEHHAPLSFHGDWHPAV